MYDEIILPSTSRSSLLTNEGAGVFVSGEEVLIVLFIVLLIISSIFVSIHNEPAILFGVSKFAHG